MWDRVVNDSDSECRMALHEEFFDPRTGNYAFHILNVADATHVPLVPDAGSTLALFSLALGGLLPFLRKLATTR